MRVISRYISRELSKVAAICLGAFAAVYMVIDFFERIDDFIEARLTLTPAVQYFLLKLPLIVQQGIPMGVLMGTLITLGLMARNNELTALKGSGLSPLNVATPVVVFALLLSLVDFALAEYIVPLSTIRANHIWNVKVKNQRLPSGFTQEKLWFKSGRRLYNVRVLHPKQKMLEGVTVHIFDDDFRLLQRLDARRGEWDGQEWVFKDGIFLQRAADGAFSMERFQRRNLKLTERPENFQHLEKIPEEMTLAELGRYAAKINSEGYDATRYMVDLHTRIAFPFTTMIMALLGLGVALYQGKQGGIAVGVAASVAVAFVYLVIFQFILSFGYSGRLHPLLAAWTSNIFFGVISLFLLIHAKH